MSSEQMARASERVSVIKIVSATDNNRQRDAMRVWLQLDIMSVVASVFVAPCDFRLWVFGDLPRAVLDMPSGA